MLGKLVTGNWCWQQTTGDLSSSSGSTLIEQDHVVSKMVYTNMYDYIGNVLLCFRIDADASKLVTRYSWPV